MLATRKPSTDPTFPLLFTAVDFAATFLFGLEGAMAAIRGNLDLRGILVLSFATALVGGVIRDVLVGALPPASLRDWRYPAIAFAAGLSVFFFHHFVQAIPVWLIVVLDAAGLSLFAITGTEKALACGMHPFIAMLLGTITGVGGGTVREVLLAQVPAVLRSDVYAAAALFGSAVMVASRRAGVSMTASAALGGVSCFVLRVVSVWQHWNLPRVTGP